MKHEGEGTRLRIYVGELDKHGQRPLYEAIVLKAREHGLAGATVVRGQMGFGAHARVHTTKILRLSENLPVVIEIVDQRAAIEQFLPQLDQLVADGLVTIEKIRTITYRTGLPQD
jgi:PII-like signaling protein